MSGPRTGRLLALFAATLLPLCAVGVGVAVYRSHTKPARLSSPSSLNRAAEDRLEHALATLNDPTLPAPERLAAYRADLRLAEDLLVRSLRAQPAQARTLARLAAVRFELDPPVTPEDDARFLAMIGTASDMAPRVPAVQVRLGELLLRLGREEEAWRYLARAVALDPTVAPEAVKLPLEIYTPPERVRRSLPAEPEVLVALQEAYFERGDLDDYLAGMDAVLDRATPRLLVCYGNAALRARDPARLLAAMERVGAKEDAHLEAERLYQRSRGRQGAGDAAAALDDARAARELLPDVPRMSEHLGNLFLTAGRGQEAIAAYREALSHVARGSGQDRDRARLYTRIGRAEEVAGRPAKAYEAYKRALEADPEEPVASRRVKEMEGRRSP